MNTKRIDLGAELSITVDGRKLTADRTKNEIRQKFDVPINGLTPKAMKHFKGAVSSSLEVKPITIAKSLKSGILL